MSGLPCEGVKVLEFCHTVMGPAGGMVLADLGADVLKIEPAPAGDPTRNLKGFATGFFSYFNRNKRSICIDLKAPEGLAIARKLVQGADILIENFGPGTMDRLGLGWKDCRRINPRLIYCELKGFLPGPYQHRPALDEVVQFLGGLAYMTGPIGRPLRAGSSIVDIMGGVMGAMAALAALRQRDSDGKGRKVAGTLFETVAFLMAQHMAQEIISGETSLPMSERVKSWGVYELFPTRTGEEIFIGCISQGHWKALCKVLEREELVQDSRFATNADRVRNRVDLRSYLTEATATHDPADLCTMLEQAGIPFSPIRTPSDLFTDPQMNVPGRMLPILMGNGTTGMLPPLPLAIDDQTMPLRLQPPAIGEHTDSVLKSLNYAKEQIRDLRQQQIVG